MFDGADSSIQMKVVFPRAGYARKGGEWSLRAGEVAVVVCVCWATTFARSRQRVLAQPVPFLIALKQLAPRMQRLELRPGRRPIHTS